MRWRAPDLNAADRAALDALDALLEAEARWGMWTAEDRAERERMLSEERWRWSKAKMRAKGGDA